MKKSIIITTLAILFGTAACTTDGVGTKQGIGTLGGAAAGGLLGSQVGGGSGKLAATAAGTLLGAFVGSEIGVSLDRADDLHRQRAIEQALVAKPRQPITWTNPQTGHRGSVTTTRRYREAGQQCREFQQTVVVGGRDERAYGTACRQQDGSWRIS
jgi:surface antigen